MLNEPATGCLLFGEEEISHGVLPEEVIPHLIPLIQQHAPHVIFLIGTCFVSIQKFDLNYLEHVLTKAFPEVLFVPVPISGFEAAYTLGEDILLASLVDKCPYPQSDEPSVVFAGAVSSVTKNLFIRELERLHIPCGGFLPPSDIRQLPAIGKKTLVAPIQPYLFLTLDKIAKNRKSAISFSFYPLGIEGMHYFLEKIAGFFGMSANTKQKEEEVRALLSDDIPVLRNTRIFIIGDNLLELSLARFLHHCGAHILEVGTPYVHFRYHREELAYLAQQNISVIETPNNISQVERIKKLRPDLVIAPLSLSYPLETQGMRTVWSVKFFQTETSIFGFENVPLLAKIFTTALKGGQ